MELACDITRPRVVLTAEPFVCLFFRGQGSWGASNLIKRVTHSQTACVCVWKRPRTLEQRHANASGLDGDSSLDKMSLSPNWENKTHRVNCSSARFSSQMLCLLNKYSNGWFHSGVCLVTQYANTMNPPNDTSYFYRASFVAGFCTVFNLLFL